MLRVVLGCWTMATLVVGTALSQEPGSSWTAVQAETAMHGYLNARLAHQTLNGDINEVFIWSRRVRDSELAAAKDAAARIAASKAQLERIDSLRRYVDLSGTRLKDGIELDFQYRDAERVLAEFDSEYKNALTAKMAVLEKLQGRWRTSQIERNGKLVEEDYIELLDIRGGIARKRSDQASKAGGGTAFIALNVDADPVEIDLVGLNADFVYSATGIVKIDGDRMELCLSPDRNNRPKGFMTTKRDRFELLTFQRVEREPEKKIANE